jgi:hypothetical protein
MACFFQLFGGSRCARALTAAALATACLSHGQTGAAAGQDVPRNVEDALHQMSDRAAVVFAGQVIAVRRPAAGASASGVVEIEFRVDQAVRGVTGSNYVLREWSGLWPGDRQRYHVGQRLLMLLQAPGSSGLSSPVGGMDGAIPIRGGGASTLPGGNAVAPQQPVADLRWVGARLLHQVSYRNASAQAALRSPLLVSQQSVDDTAATSVNGGAGAASVADQQATVDAVLGMLSSWQKASDVAP